MDHNLLIALKISLIGISVVFTALVLIGLCIHLLSRLEQSPQPKADNASDDQEPDLISDEVAAVIAAAVATTMGPKVRVRRIRHTGLEEAGVWSRQGRVIIMAGHRPRN